MVNRANMIHGRHVDRHPLSDHGQLADYTKHASVLAAQAQQSGVIDTPEGQMTFQAGDWILTDNPPTHAWPIREDVFRSTYTLVHVLEEGQYPTSAPVVDDKVVTSAPPANVVDIKNAAMASDPTMSEDEAEAEQRFTQPINPDPVTKMAEGQKAEKKRGIATAKTLGME
jgi:hypothetical protein